MGTGQHLQANNVFNQQHDAGAVHRPEIDGGTVCFSKVQTSLGSAAHHQVQWHHARPVYSYREVVNPGNQVYEILGILDTRPLSSPPRPGSSQQNMVWQGGQVWREPRRTRLWTRSRTSSMCALELSLHRTRQRRLTRCRLISARHFPQDWWRKNNFVDVPANSQMRKSN